MALDEVSGDKVMSAAGSASRRDKESKGLRMLNDEVRVLLASKTAVDERNFMIAETTNVPVIIQRQEGPMAKVMDSLAVIKESLFLTVQ